MKKLLLLLICLCAVSAHAQTFYTSLANDTAGTGNPSSTWPKTTQLNDLMVCYGGTQLTGGQISGTFTADTNGCTFSDSTIMTTCAITGCDFAGVSSLDTRVWVGTSGGSTTPTFQVNTSIPGSTIGGVAMELTAVNSVDQVSSNGSSGVAGGGTITSGSITTGFSNEIMLCLSQEANPIGGGNHLPFQTPTDSGGGTWTPVAFGNQGIAYQVVASPGTHNCGLTLGAGVAEDYAMTIISFYQASGVAPSNANLPALTLSTGYPVPVGILTTTSGVWAGSATISYAYQWYRCGLGGVNCVAIPGATATTYSLTTADIGFVDLCTVKATNSAGFAVASSLPTSRKTIGFVLQ